MVTKKTAREYAKDYYQIHKEKIKLKRISEYYGAKGIKQKDFTTIVRLELKLKVLQKQIKQNDTKLSERFKCITHLVDKKEFLQEVYCNSHNQVVVIVESARFKVYDRNSFPEEKPVVILCQGMSDADFENMYEDEIDAPISFFELWCNINTSMENYIISRQTQVILM